MRAPSLSHLLLSLRELAQRQLRPNGLDGKEIPCGSAKITCGHLSMEGIVLWRDSSVGTMF
jgi:hypothetical protein